MVGACSTPSPIASGSLNAVTRVPGWLKLIPREFEALAQGRLPVLGTPDAGDEPHS
jgi:hypothetical protein